MLAIIAQLGLSLLLGRLHGDVAAPPRVMHWHGTYEDAVRQAVGEQKMLLIYFHSDRAGARQRRFEDQTLNDTAVQQKLDGYVLAKLPLTATWVEKSTGKSRTLLDHPAFRHMRHKPGLAIIDCQNVDTSWYGRVVSCLPFESIGYYAPNAEGILSVQTLLALPPGNITQRTMVYAVRLHPEHPASTRGKPHPVLFEAAQQHSRHQAAIRLQGHHNWGSRFRRIWSRLRRGRPPVEVCAESWPNESLVSACFSCVYAWRQSSGHWSAVRSRHVAYGYDIRRGSNGIWYATGIFGG